LPLFLDLFIKIEINWRRMIEYEIVLLLLFFIAVASAHYIDVCARVVNVHNVVNDLHVLSLFLTFFIINSFWADGVARSQGALIGIIICLVRLHVNLIKFPARVLSVVQTLI
jgi:hypothetical protein